MPYIKQIDRDKFKFESDDGHKTIPYELIENCGELNYVITVICQNYLKRKGLRYQNCNDIIGALESAKIEFYRKIVADYENEKIQENGDVLDI